MPRLEYDDIFRFPHSSYTVDVSWRYLLKQLQEDVRIGLDLNPDFQRGHVWRVAQQIAYVEYVMAGGEVSKTIVFAQLAKRVFETGDDGKVPGYVLLGDAEALAEFRL